MTPRSPAPEDDWNAPALVKALRRGTPCHNALANSKRCVNGDECDGCRVRLAAADFIESLRRPTPAAASVGEDVNGLLQNTLRCLESMDDKQRDRADPCVTQYSMIRGLADNIRAALRTVTARVNDASVSSSPAFDWTLVNDAVYDAICNGEGVVSERYLKLAFEHHGLIVMEKPK